MKTLQYGLSFVHYFIAKCLNRTPTDVKNHHPLVAFNVNHSLKKKPNLVAMHPYILGATLMTYSIMTFQKQNEQL